MYTKCVRSSMLNTKICEHFMVIDVKPFLVTAVMCRSPMAKFVFFQFWSLVSNSISGRSSFIHN